MSPHKQGSEYFWEIKHNQRRVVLDLVVPAAAADTLRCPQSPTTQTPESPLSATMVKTQPVSVALES